MAKHQPDERAIQWKSNNFFIVNKLQYNLWHPISVLKSIRRLPAPLVDELPAPDVNIPKPCELVKTANVLMTHDYQIILVLSVERHNSTLHRADTTVDFLCPTFRTTQQLFPADLLGPQICSSSESLLLTVRCPSKILAIGTGNDLPTEPASV